VFYVILQWEFCQLLWSEWKEKLQPLGSYIWIWYLSMWHAQKRNIPQFKFEILLLFCDFRMLEVGNNSLIFDFICFPVLKYVCVCLYMYVPYFRVTEHTFCKIYQNFEIVLVHSYNFFPCCHMCIIYTFM
jgi:hypothetical protein